MEATKRIARRQHDHDEPRRYPPPMIVRHPSGFIKPYLLSKVARPPPAVGSRNQPRGYRAGAYRAVAADGATPLACAKNRKRPAMGQSFSR